MACDFVFCGKRRPPVTETNIVEGVKNFFKLPSKAKASPMHNGHEERIRYKSPTPHVVSPTTAPSEYVDSLLRRCNT